jgi:hypothetical protein
MVFASKLNNELATICLKYASHVYEIAKTAQTSQMKSKSFAGQKPDYRTIVKKVNYFNNSRKLFDTHFLQFWHFQVLSCTKQY